MTDIEFLRDLASSLIVVPHKGDMVDWADGNLRIPYSVRYPIFMAGESPWLIEPMRALCDPKVRRIDVRMPAGAAKSLIGEVHIAYCLNEAPGMYYYVWQTDDDGKDAMEDRIMPMIEANDFLSKRLPLDRSKKRTTKIAFPHMSFYSVGANLSAAQSKRQIPDDGGTAPLPAGNDDRV
jgi:phage terminase large subunit GpA-like protein